MGGALLVHELFTGFEPFGGVVVAGVFVAAALAEVMDFWLSMRFTERYGGSRRSGLAAIGGGLAGALIGVPVPIVGSVVGAFVGAFAGATLAEYLARKDGKASLTAGWGAVLGRATSAAVKVAVGLAVVVVATWQVVTG